MRRKRPARRHDEKLDGRGPQLRRRSRVESNTCTTPSIMHKRVCLLGVSLDTFLTILRIRDHHRVERDPPGPAARRGRSRRRGRASLALAAGVREVVTNRPAAHSARSRPPPRSRRARYWVYPYCRGREPARPYGRARCDPPAARAASATGTAVRTHRIESGGLASTRAAPAATHSSRSAASAPAAAHALNTGIRFVTSYQHFRISMYRRAFVENTRASYPTCRPLLIVKSFLCL